MTDTRVQLIVNEAAKVGVATSKPPMQWLFAHGAGAPMDSDFMNRLAEGVAAGGITVKRFEFPYMEQRRETGKKRPPDRAPKLLDHFAEVIKQEPKGIETGNKWLDKAIVIGTVGYGPNKEIRFEVTTTFTCQ